MVKGDTLLTQKAAEKAVVWAQESLGLRDWRILVHIKAVAPVWAEPCDTSDVCGMSWIKDEDEEAEVWISPERCANKKSDALTCLFHELTHVLLGKAGVNASKQTTRQWETLCNRIGEVLASAYKAPR